MRRRSRREGLEGRRSGWAVVGRVRISVGVAVRGRMGVSRVRRRWPMGLVEVRIILIHHIGAAHHPARARHPRAGLQTCVPERRTTLSNNTTPELVLQLRRWLTPRSDQTFEIIKVTKVRSSLRITVHAVAYNDSEVVQCIIAEQLSSNTFILTFLR